jgi:hypothetical protein
MKVVFNPNVGMYDVQSDTGPSFATRRQEAFNALTQIAAQNKEFMQIGGDLLWKVADFPEADVLAERWRRTIAPNVLGDGLPPNVQQAMQQSADKIEALLKLITEQQQQIKDKDKELTIKAQELDLRHKEAIATHSRLDYDSETKRVTALGNSGPAISPEAIQPVVKQLLIDMLRAGGPGEFDRLASQIQNSPVPLPESAGDGEIAGASEGAEDQPPIPGARLAPDGHHYIADPNRPGKFLRVEKNAA